MKIHKLPFEDYMGRDVMCECGCGFEFGYEEMEFKTAPIEEEEDMFYTRASIHCPLCGKEHWFSINYKREVPGEDDLDRQMKYREWRKENEAKREE